MPKFKKKSGLHGNFTFIVDGIEYIGMYVPSNHLTSLSKRFSDNENESETADAWQALVPVTYDTLQDNDDFNDLDRYKYEFNSLSNEQKQKLLSNFIKNNKSVNNRPIIKTAREMLAQLQDVV